MGAKINLFIALYSCITWQSVNKHWSPAGIWFTESEYYCGENRRSSLSHLYLNINTEFRVFSSPLKRVLSKKTMSMGCIWGRAVWQQKVYHQLKTNAKLTRLLVNVPFEVSGLDTGNVMWCRWFGSGHPSISSEWVTLWLRGSHHMLSRSGWYHSDMCNVSIGYIDSRFMLLCHQLCEDQCHTSIQILY